MSTKQLMSRYASDLEELIEALIEAKVSAKKAGGHGAGEVELRLTRVGLEYHNAPGPHRMVVVLDQS